MDIEVHDNSTNTGCVYSRNWKQAKCAETKTEIMAGFHSVHGRGVELVRKSEYDDEEEEEEKERDDVLEVRRLRGAEDERVAFR